jgi:hypothetical protein
VYFIVIRKDGLREWRYNGATVNLTADGCHVETVHLDAALQPIS